MIDFEQMLNELIEDLKNLKQAMEDFENYFKETRLLIEELNK